MDGKSIEISTNVTTEDFKRIGLRRVRGKLILAGGMLLVFVILITLGIIISLLSKNNPPLTAFLSMLIPVGVSSFVLFAFVRAVNKQAKQIGDRIEPTDYVFDEQGMKAENASTSVKTLWSAFLKVEETKTDFLLFTQKNIAVPIPKRFFTTNNQITDFRNLLAKNLGR